MVQRLGLCASTEEGTGSIPGQGTKKLQAVWYGQEQKQSEKTETKEICENFIHYWSFIAYDFCL